MGMFGDYKEAQGPRPTPDEQREKINRDALAAFLRADRDPDEIRREWYNRHEGLTFREHPWAFDAGEHLHKWPESLRHRMGREVRYFTIFDHVDGAWCHDAWELTDWRVLDLLGIDVAVWRIRNGYEDLEKDENADSNGADVS